MAGSNCTHSRGLIHTCQTSGIQCTEKGLKMIDTKKITPAGNLKRALVQDSVFISLLYYVNNLNKKRILYSRGVQVTLGLT